MPAMTRRGIAATASLRDAVDHGGARAGKCGQVLGRAMPWSRTSTVPAAAAQGCGIRCDIWDAGLERIGIIPVQCPLERSEPPVNSYPPVRKIGIQTRSITGTMPGGNRYESSLERDLMELVRGDPDFASFHPQPVRIEYTDESGVVSSYTPDALIFWQSGRRPLLAEVKHREDFHGLWKEWLQKFRVAREYARDRGWDFAVFTEDRIRGPRLQNLRFLHAYREQPLDPSVERAILAAIRAGDATPKSVLERLGSNGYDKASALPSLWRMIALHIIQIDWNCRLGMASDLQVRG